MHDRCTGLCLVLIMLPITLRAQTARRNFDSTAVDETQRNASNMASTYVPLDSWVYAAFDRLAALGYVQTDFAALRPWTRMECARLVLEAEDRTADSESDSETAALY